MNKDKVIGIAIMIGVLTLSIALATMVAYLIINYPDEALLYSLIVVLSAILFSLISRMIMKD